MPPTGMLQVDEQDVTLRSDPAYIAYYYANKNINPRLAPPVTSWDQNNLLAGINPKTAAVVAPTPSTPSSDASPLRSDTPGLSIEEHAAMHRAFSNSPAPHSAAAAAAAAAAVELANMGIGTLPPPTTDVVQGFLSRHASPAPDLSGATAVGYPAESLLHDRLASPASTATAAAVSQAHSSRIAAMHETSSTNSGINDAMPRGLQRQHQQHQQQYQQQQQQYYPPQAWRPPPTHTSHGYNPSMPYHDLPPPDSMHMAPHLMMMGGHAPSGYVPAAMPLYAPPMPHVMMPPGAYMPYGLASFSPPTHPSALSASVSIPVPMSYRGGVSHAAPMHQAPHASRAPYGTSPSTFPVPAMGMPQLGVSPEVSSYTQQLEPYFQSVGFDPATAQLAAKTMAHNVASMFPATPPHQHNPMSRAVGKETAGVAAVEEKEEEDWGNMNSSNIPPEVMHAAYQAAMQAIASMQGQFRGDGNRRGGGGGGGGGGRGGGGYDNRRWDGMDESNRRRNQQDQAPRNNRNNNNNMNMNNNNNIPPMVNGIKIPEHLSLLELDGRGAIFAMDQNGSRFLQQKLEAASPAEVEALWKDVASRSLELMQCMFANYVMQRMLEVGSSSVRLDMAKAMESHVLALSLHNYGCRVVQKALEVLDKGACGRMAAELAPHTLRCVQNENGNHVIQKMVEVVRCSHVDGMISTIHEHVLTLSMHSFGCRVVQRVLEHCSHHAAYKQLVSQVVEAAESLATDKFANYVVQYVAIHGSEAERTRIVTLLLPRLVELAQQKFASNVMEKAIENAPAAVRSQLVARLLEGGDGEAVVILVRDQFANFVVQKLLLVCSPSERYRLLAAIREHVPALRRSTYARHIVSRIDILQLTAEEMESRAIALDRWTALVPTGSGAMMSR